jgi:hypothetical protein
MKKILFLFISSIILAGCNTTIVSNLEMETIDVNVRANDWQYTHMPDNNYFRCVVDMPEITSKVFDQGEVKVYRKFYDKQNNDFFKHILPDVFHVKENQFLYTITVDYIYGVGWLEFNYRVSDFAYDEGNYMDFAPEAMTFSIVVTKGY